VAALYTVLCPNGHIKRFSSTLWLLLNPYGHRVQKLCPSESESEFWSFGNGVKTFHHFYSVPALSRPYISDDDSAHISIHFGGSLVLQAHKCLASSASQPVRKKRTPDQIIQMYDFTY
jgi:hypothetical protein